ncbi:MAG TPA: flagellar basal-body MS-ring/collar protein FliF [Terriglobia bacterium]|nr:flagellar basal-body MS-ring/collar protein FliF [Terriglobia bacterium]
MALRPKETVDQVQKYMRALSRKQQITLGAGTCLVLLGLLVFIFLIDRADYKTLYTGLQPEEAQFIARTLAANNIPYEISSDATSLRVPASKVDSVRLDLASQGLPQTGRLGLELFDKPNWAGSDFAERVNYQRALEGELERTIRAIRQVQSARVHLVLSHDSLFSERERAAKASVVVKLRGGKLADSALRSITYLVASAVDDLRPENVTVIDADGNVPMLSGGHTQGVNHDEIEDMEHHLSEKLISTLTPLVGHEGLRASVTVEYDLASSESTQETYDPNGSVVLTSQVSEDQSTDTEPQGIPGTPSNAPDSSAKGAASAASDSTPEQAGQRSESKTYAVSKAVRHVVQPSGGIKRIAAAILVDDAIETKTEGDTKVESRRKRSAEELKQIEELAKAAIGIDPARGDHLSVQNISFASLSPGPPPDLPERLAPIVQEWMGVIRYVGLAALFLMIYVLVLRPVKRQIMAALAVEQPQLAGRVAEQGALGKGGTPPRELTPEAGAGASEGVEELTDINASVKRTVVLKNQLVERIKKNPEAASRLIQSWVQQGEAET